MALAGDIDFGVAVNQAKVEVLSSLSNKVRTPISVVLGNTEMIMRETGESLKAGRSVLFDVVFAPGCDCLRRIQHR